MILYLMLVLFIVLAAASVFFVIKKRYVPTGKESAVVRAPVETLIMAVMLYIAGIALIVAKIMIPDLAGSDAEAQKFIVIFALLCVVSACATLLHTLLRTAVAFPDRMVVFSAIGEKTEMRWNEVKEIKVPFLTKQATFISDTQRITVNGKDRDYHMFIGTAKSKIPASIASDVLGNLYNKTAKRF